MKLPIECLKYFAKIIEDEIGIIYSEVNYYQLESRLEDIAKQLGIDGPMALWNTAQQQGISGPMKLLIVDIATNNETSFFRDPNVFKAIGKMIGNAVDADPRKTYQIWSAACSTGQEIYSLAILLSELNANFQILATDVTERVLKRAESGVYSQLEVQRGLSMPQLVKYFIPDEVNSQGNVQNWTVRPELRKGMRFQKLNLLEPWPPFGPFDLILCRNVLIYQTIESKKKVVSKLYDYLTPGGYLVLGGAESLIGIFDGLEYTTLENTVVYRKAIKGGT